MKTTLVILCLMAMTGTGIYFSMPKPATNIVSVMSDHTDKFLSEPEVQTILPFLGLSGNEWNGADFRFQDLTSVSFNRVREISIPPASEWLSNDLEREMAVKTFDGNMNQIITDSTKDSIGMRHSSLYVPIARELNFLSQSTSQRRVLLIYSDLMENDPSFSFYSKKTFCLISKQPNTVKEHFQKEVPLNNLAGIEVYLIYEPKGTLDDSEFQAASGFYKSLLESAGAKVTITANL